MVPAGTPDDIVARLNAEFNKALQSPHVRRLLEDAGYGVVGGTCQAFAELIDIETRKWARVVRDASIRVD